MPVRRRNHGERAQPHEEEFRYSRLYPEEMHLGSFVNTACYKPYFHQKSFALDLS